MVSSCFAWSVIVSAHSIATSGFILATAGVKRDTTASRSFPGGRRLINSPASTSSSLAHAATATAMASPLPSPGGKSRAHLTTSTAVTPSARIISEAIDGKANFIAGSPAYSRIHSAASRGARAAKLSAIFSIARALIFSLGKLCAHAIASSKQLRKNASSPRGRCRSDSPAPAPVPAHETKRAPLHDQPIPRLLKSAP